MKFAQSIRKSSSLTCVKQVVAALCVAISVTLAPLSAQPVQLPEGFPSEDDLPIALLVDATSNQVLYARNPERRFVPASITKVMTLYLAFEEIERGNLDLRQTITVDEEIAKEWSGKGSSMFLQPNDQVALTEILTGIATVSANDASMILAQYSAGSIESWTSRMTETARALGMTSSHFGTPNGWPDEGRTFTTAYDLATLAKALLSRHPKKVAQFIGRPDFRYGTIAQRNRDPIIGQVRGADGIKTGYTNEAGFGFLGSAKRNGQRLVMVLGGASRKMFRDPPARDLIEWGFDAFDRRRLLNKGQEVGTARVQGGVSRSVELVTDRLVWVNIPKGKSSELKTAITYDGPLRAPIAAGDHVATLVVSVPGLEPARIPLLAKADIAEAGFLGRISNAFAEWFG